MARELVVLWAERPRRDSWASLCDDYATRIKRTIRIQDIPIKVRKTTEDRARLRSEGKALLEAFPEDAWLVALDRRGKMQSSTEMASWLQGLIDD